MEKCRRVSKVPGMTCVRQKGISIFERGVPSLQKCQRKPYRLEWLDGHDASVVRNHKKIISMYQ